MEFGVLGLGFFVVLVNTLMIKLKLLLSPNGRSCL